MKRSGLRKLLLSFAGSAALAFAGCAPAGQPAKAVIPTGAALVAYGANPVPPFFPPAGGGTLYVWDVEAKQVALVTTYPAYGTKDHPAGPGMNLADMQGAHEALPPGHHFAVYYGPPPGAPPAAAPVH